MIKKRVSHFARTKKTALLTVFALLSPTICDAQNGHSDIEFGFSSGRIVTDKLIYESAFPTDGFSMQFTSNPGFAAEADGFGVISPNTDIVYHVLDDLMLWDGDRFVVPDPGVQIRIQNNPPGIADTIVDASSNVQFGSVSPPKNRVGASNDSGEVHSHLNFFLEPNVQAPPWGAYGIKLAISADREDLVDSDPVFVVFNYGLDEAPFELGVSEYERLLVGPVTGDFSGNGVLDVDDIDLLTNGIYAAEFEPRFDLNGDSVVDQDDRRFWIEDLGRTWLGDSNLDGEFNSTDLVVTFQVGEYENEAVADSSWEDGDWSGDREFDSHDIILAFQTGGFEQGPLAAAAVPEPNSIAFALIGLCMVVHCRKARPACFI